MIIFALVKSKSLCFLLHRETELSIMIVYGCKEIDAKGENTMDILNRLRKNRAKICDITASYRVIYAKYQEAYQWGSKQDKYFFISHDYQHSSQSFDGQKSHGLSQHRQPFEIPQFKRAFEFTGSIYSPNRCRPMVNYTPWYLCGDCLMGSDLQLPQLLAKAQSLTVRPETEDVNGIFCAVLEAHSIMESDRLQSILIWLDPQRDFLPLKIESYNHDNIKAPNQKTTTPFTDGCLCIRIDNISLNSFDGIWFPVSGRYQHFHPNIYLPDGRNANDLTQEEALDIQKTMTEKELLEKSRFTNELRSTSYIEVNDVKINHGIDDSRFQIQFPAGCAVYDEFYKHYYVAGEPSEQETALSSEDWEQYARDLPFEKLLDILREFQLGVGTQKTFAAIKALVENGQSFLPRLCKTLQDTTSPKMQSLLSVVLRAIGSKEAVPVLIETLANCKETSDYGLGSINTSLDRYYHNLQLDSKDKDLGLRRPVREITGALEKITGHSEGHDHFDYSRDQHGNKLEGSRTISDELVQLKRQQTRQTADRWRTWWQQREK
jgi:hypothetical protein